MPPRHPIFIVSFFSQRSVIRCLWAAMAVVTLAGAVLAFSEPEITTTDDDTTVIIRSAPEQEVYVFGRSVIVKQSAKGVLAIGGDVTVEGRVEGDVATVGGNVIQEETAYIGGDVIVFGGSYKPKADVPLREPGKETVMFAALENEIKDMTRDPIRIFAPAFTWSFLIQRVVVALLWFIVTMIVSTMTPGAVSRAVVNISLSPTRVSAVGAGALLAGSVITVASAAWLPSLLSATVVIMVFLLFLMGYLFGRVSLQVSTGKWLQRKYFPKNNRSETLAILTGVAAWTLLLSLPYLWMLALFAIFSVGIGSILTARTRPRPDAA